MSHDEFDKFFALSIGWQADSPYFRRGKRQTFKKAGYPACQIAELQECRNAGLAVSKTACCLYTQSDG